jgi:crotonobetainyl-CoA:carnitine CoA-transferase CaiB-like acyl-CoA transferase
VPNLPIRFHGTPARPRGYAPRLGEHSREVLESYGFDHAEIDSLIAAAVVTAEEPHAG